MLREQLGELLGPVVANLGYELWEIEYAPRAGGGLLRLYIDSPDGISLDDCERVSRAVSAVLDEADPIPNEYTLEVSSPGLDRVLRTRAHFERFNGERVKVEMIQQINGRKRFQGRLKQVGESEITLEMDGGEVSLPIEDIHRARLVPDV
ncbi:ribosome maturation factor RimP [Steroidobacter sp. S1-65]|uniref:Ribosome maturation factor RimP n=1 Tax=Steroidobacter gossypii TaxID=2805490 RepID=A0ABS1WWD7_9GAMM|nr:ribosome maturation factor RimP [Steroidobacter gossypii]MBM0105285.1 ribosome maturation factor RimP [Steroidobacter gossypii]